MKKIYCADCDAEISHKSRFYYDGEVHCASCFSDWVKEYADLNPEDVAKQLNVDFKEAINEYL